MLASVTGEASKGTRLTALGMETLAALAVAAWLCPLAAAGQALFALLWVFFYCRLTKREFGGVTGDTAGFFLQSCELLLLLGTIIGGAL